MGPDRTACELRRIAKRVGGGSPSAAATSLALRRVLASVDTDSSSEQVSYSWSVLEQVTDEMRSDMGVAPDAKPFDSGANSAVFVTDKGNIVVFSDYYNLPKVARKAQSLGSDTLPDIYEVKDWKMEDEEEGSFTFGDNSMYAVEMEHLKVLDDAEGNLFEKWKKPVFKGEGEVGEVPEEEQEFVDSMRSLAERAGRDKVVQTDLWAGNIARDSSGLMKFIDLEVVDLDGANLAPQAEAT